VANRLLKSEIYLTYKHNLSSRLLFIVQYLFNLRVFSVDVLLLTRSVICMLGWDIVLQIHFGSLKLMCSCLNTTNFELCVLKEHILGPWP